MKSKVFVVSLAVTIGCVLAELRSVDADIGLMNFMIATRELQKENPKRSLDCFDYYTPIINQNYETYQQQYRDCIRTADAARFNIDELYEPQRQQIDANSTGLCNLLGNCRALNSTSVAFQCYAAVGANNSLILHDIAVNASESFAEIVEQIRLIEFQQERCTNASESRYVQATADTYEDLHNCLIGVLPVPSSSTSSPSASTPVAFDSSAHIIKNRHTTRNHSLRVFNNIRSHGSAKFNK